MAKTSSNNGGSKSSSSSVSSLSGTDWTDDPRAIMQVAANARVTGGNARPGDTYRSGSESQQERVDNVLTQRATQQAPTPAPASQRPQPAGTVTARPVGNNPDYLDMIYDQAFGSNGLPVNGSKLPPTPMKRPDWYGNPELPQGNEEQAVQDAVDRGISLEQIAAGAIGGGATALIAKSIIDQMRNKGGPSQTITNSNTSNPGGSKSGDILERNGLQSGVPTMNNDINRQFYELFGTPMPTGTGTEPRLMPGPGVLSEPYEVKSDPFNPRTSIPGPNNATKSTATQQPQLGDMDSPTYRDNFGLTAISNEAQRIFDQMEMYGDYRPENYGLDPSSSPAVYRAVQSLIRNAM